MRACVQRVREAHVAVANEVVGRIGRGLLVLLGVARDDDRADAEFLADKCVDLRIFDDDGGKMNRSLVDVRGGLLAVSQFTLLGDCRKGRRPSFVDAAPPEWAEPLYDVFVERVRARGVPIETGRFRTHMSVSLVNDGPVTILIDSRRD
ncbi:MAG: D-tyrosyl-tRNA(Tyr) deacylase [Planctomycetes bacterium]|nr:D-tyrosyl-tRNA(Tyr) deacylase [Planctomycetota bacterium]